jgi:glucokinase
VLNREPALTVGVDVGGTSVRAGVVDPSGTILDTVRSASAGDESALEGTIAGAVKELGVRHQVAAVGLAVAGFVTPDRRTVRFAPHLPWRDAPLADRMAERCGLPVVVEHDANAAALAEQRFGAGSRDAAGHGEGWASTVFVALGTGIGAALLVEGRIYRGAFGVAPELGHLRVMPDGRACDCGKRGCWERYCSGTALVTTYDELGDPAGDPAEPSGLTGLEVADAARAGDPAAVRAVAELARWLGEGLALVGDVFDPELVVIGGGVSGSADLFLDAAREHYARALTGARHRPAARIRVARLGENGAVVGAAQLAREHLTGAGG